MTQWEYVIMSGTEGTDELQETIKPLGLEGWEAVNMSIDHQSLGEIWCVLLKRQISN